MRRAFPRRAATRLGWRPQYCGALGKLANCQVAVSLHYAAGGTTLEAPSSAALGWRLFLPREWIDDPARRQKAGVPESVTYRSKHTLALELVDEALARELPPPRCWPTATTAMITRGAPPCERVAWATAWRWNPAPRRGRARRWASPPPAAGRPAPKDPLPAPQTPGPARARVAQGSLAQRALARGHPWTDAGPLCAGGPSGPATATPSASTEPPAPASGSWSSGRWTRTLRPTTGSRTWGPWSRERPPSKRLAGLARERWRVEQDYRELKDELGLDHFEGRSWPGWHHHVALTCLAHLFLQTQRRPATRATQKKPGPGGRPGKPAADAPPPARRFSCGDHATAVLGATPASTPPRKSDKVILTDSSSATGTGEARRNEYERPERRCLFAGARG